MMVRSARPQREPKSGVVAVATPTIDRNVARQLAATVSSENRLAFARSFTFATAKAYATSLDTNISNLEAAPDAGLILLPPAAQDAAIRFGSALADVTLS